MTSATVHDFKAWVGKSRPTPNAAFLSSLTGNACYKAADDNWLAAVLPDSVTKAGGSVQIPIRLCTFVFLPALLLDSALDDGDVMFFPLPLPLGEFLRLLLAKGMPAVPVSSPVAAQELVLDYAAQLTNTERLLRRDQVGVIAATGTSLEGVTPSLLRGADIHNGMLAWLLSLLPGYYTGLTDGQMPSALALLRPVSAQPGDPVALLAVKVCSAFRDTHPEPPFDTFVVFGNIVSELMRRRQPTEEAMFAPLFDEHWRRVYPALALAFPEVKVARVMKRTIQTLAQSIDFKLSFTAPGVSGFCIMIKPLLGQLNADAPAASSDADERVQALARLMQRSLKPSLTSASAGGVDKLDGEERYDKLLSDPDYSDLYARVSALNTSAFVSADAVRIVLRHKHPAGHIVVATSRTPPQAVWASVLGMRQKSAWQSMFDGVLSVDRLGVLHQDWGVLLPMKGEVPVHAQWLVMGQLDKIIDWWLMLTPWVRKYHGEHIIHLPMYAATDDPIDFWLSADRLRLTEPALSALFAAVGHGESRSVPGSFREWLHFHIERCVQLQHVPQGTLAQSALIDDSRWAIRLLFSNFSEACATMLIRPFHEARRQPFNPATGAATSFKLIDGNIEKTQQQLALAQKGQAAHQSLQFQQYSPAGGGDGADRVLSVGALVPGQSPNPKSPVSLQMRSGALTGVWPSGVYTDWGHAAAHLGMWYCPEGIAFGKLKVAASKNVSFADGTCMAAAGPAKDARSRSKWCVDPMGCKKLGYAAHERPVGTTDADFTVVEYDERTADRSGWKTIMEPKPELIGEKRPQPPWPTTVGPSRDWKPVHVAKRGAGDEDLRSKITGGANKGKQPKGKRNFQGPTNDGCKPLSASESGANDSFGRSRSPVEARSLHLHAHCSVVVRPWALPCLWLVP